MIKLSKTFSKKQVGEVCDKFVEEGKLVKINPESKEPRYQNTDNFLKTVWGITGRYETCEKCKEPVDLMQNEFMRLDIGSQMLTSL